MLFVCGPAACVGHINDTGHDGSVAGDARSDLGASDSRTDTPVVPPNDVATVSDVPTVTDVTTPTDTPTPPPDGPIEPGFDAGPCGATTLVGAMTVTPIGVSARHAAPTSTGGVVVLGNMGSSTVMQRYDGAGSPVGSSFPVSASETFGIAASPDRYAVLYARDSDVLALSIFDTAGTRQADTVLLGGVPHDVTNNEWFGALIRQGRVTWSASGNVFVPYFTVQRLWPDGVAHYGDSLRTVRPDGSPDSTIWGWGCSHSMEVRIAAHAAGLGPMCVSDCYPGKGVYFNHNTQVYSDPSGNCAGTVNSRAGGIAPVSGGFVMAFRSPEGRSSNDAAVVFVSDGGTVGTVAWLSSGPDAQSVDVAALGDGAVAGWVVGSTGYVQRISSSGVPIATAETIAPDLLSGATDFFTYDNGDAGWVAGGGSGSRLVRIRGACM
jgi:hypothetical protein